MPAQVGAADLRIALDETAIELNEIVVTGTAGGVQKRALGNSVAKVNAERDRFRRAREEHAGPVERARRGRGGHAGHGHGGQRLAHPHPRRPLHAVALQAIR